MQEMAGEPSKAALGWVVDTEQWQEGLKQEYRLSVKMALLQGKLHTNRLILISWNIQPGYYMLELHSDKGNCWASRLCFFGDEITLESSNCIIYFMF